MNPWGWVLIAIAIAAIVVGITGSQNKLYAFITGNTPSMPGSGNGTYTPLQPMPQAPNFSSVLAQGQTAVQQTVASVIAAVNSGFGSQPAPTKKVAPGRSSGTQIV